MENTLVNRFVEGQAIHTLIPIQIEGWKTVCSAGYMFYIVSVDEENQTMVIRRDSDKTTVKFEDVEQAYKIVNGISYDFRTCDEVVRALEMARSNNIRIRLHYGFTEKHEGKEIGKDWLEENDVEGRVSCSCGPTKTPILVNNKRSFGGGCILTSSIVKIRTTGKNGHFLFVHPRYHHGVVTVRKATVDGYITAVDIDGVNHANFKSIEKAENWLHKMELSF